MNIGKAIVALRKEKNYSQENLAYDSEISRHYMYKLENNLASPTISMLEKICKTLHIELSELIHRAEDLTL